MVRERIKGSFQKILRHWRSPQRYVGKGSARIKHLEEELKKSLDRESDTVRRNIELFGQIVSLQIDLEKTHEKLNDELNKHLECCLRVEDLEKELIKSLERELDFRIEDLKKDLSQPRGR